jgi:hypothetical protein
MTVAEVVPVTAAIWILSLAGALTPVDAAVAIALLGAMLGFAPFNRPVAKLFLGDVGSLPIGLLLFWLLLRLAAGGHLVAAIELSLYYVADATITLALRLARRENVLRAHRTHFYQRATDRGYSVADVVTSVFFVNVGSPSWRSSRSIGNRSGRRHSPWRSAAWRRSSFWRVSRAASGESVVSAMRLLKRPAKPGIHKSNGSGQGI